MITILHGENTILSREVLHQIITEANQKNTHVGRIDSPKLTLAELEQSLGETSLFAEKKLIIIDCLHSLPKSKNKNALISLIAGSNIDIVLWEKRSLTPTMIKKFPSAKVQEFKLTNSLFKWLDMLKPSQSNLKNETRATLATLKSALDQNGEQMCFAMLSRQIRLLIQSKTNAKIAAAPFVISKLKSVASAFSISQLLKLHQLLLEIDTQFKTSLSLLSVEQQLSLISIQIVQGK